MLDQLGLTSAIETMIENVEESSGISFSVKIDNIDGLFEEKMEINVYRIIQESLNNIIKHSGAKKTQVKILKTNGQVNISVKDNGKGLDIENEKIKRGFGLAGIRERTRILNGKLEINSQINKGAELKIMIPLDKII